MTRVELQGLEIVCIGAWDNGFDENDEEYLSESLIHTIDGRYLLYCEGGEMTYYSRFEDGVEVKQIAKEDAWAWAVSRGLSSTIERHYAVVA